MNQIHFYYMHIIHLCEYSEYSEMSIQLWHVAQGVLKLVDIWLGKNDQSVSVGTYLSPYRTLYRVNGERQGFIT